MQRVAKERKEGRYPHVLYFTYMVLSALFGCFPGSSLLLFQSFRLGRRATSVWVHNVLQKMRRMERKVRTHFVNNLIWHVEKYLVGENRDWGGGGGLGYRGLVPCAASSVHKHKGDG